MAGIILVPLDGSPLAEQGIQAACRVAMETDAELLLLTAVPFSVHAGAAERDRERVALAEARQHLTYHKQVVARYGIVARTLLLPGDAVRAILFAADNEDVALISMATHGRSGLRQALLGSVAAAVVRDTRVPILLSRMLEWPHAHAMLPYNHVLVPLDGTPFAEAALQVVQGQGLGRAGELLLLRAVERARFQAITPKVPGDDAVSLFDVVKQETARRVQQADDYLHGVGALYPDLQPYRIVVATDTPARAIADTICRDHVDLVVVATHDRHGVDRVLHGSVAWHVLQHGDVPVLLVHGAAHRTTSETPATNQPDDHALLVDAVAEQIVREQLERDTVGSAHG